MRKKIGFGILFILLAVVAYSKVTVPAAITANFSKVHPQAQSIKWEGNKHEYEVHFKEGGQDYSISYSLAGSIMETEHSIDFTDLPAAVQTVASKKGKAKEVAEITSASGAKYYEVQIGSKDYFFDANGSEKNVK
ncbi:MAG: hypothetical protein EBX41_02775 [Chitinophagia bacterium]|nr:hypothetical protein [Chitinophagia bacterium]